jgi:hypothetical protein
MNLIHNTFHNTEYASTLSRVEIERRTEILYWTFFEDVPGHVVRWRNKVRRALCGIDECTCGNSIGERRPVSALFGGPGGPGPLRGFRDYSDGGSAG